jgi:hypothetical protein
MPVKFLSARKPASIIPVGRTISFKAKNVLNFKVNRFRPKVCWF